MFDPLDLYSPDEGLSDNHEEKSHEAAKVVPDFVTSNQDDQDDHNIQGDDQPIDVLDLPSVHYASPEVILSALLLLKPKNQINFQNDKSDELTVADICLQKGITKELMDFTLGYYQTWGNSRLDTAEKICRKIPLLMSMGERLLNYYTSVLKHYEGLANPTNDQILKEVSLRISENCGRTAQPTMTRQFKFEDLNSCVEIHEPSLTADNLGWKTWGSSFILSQKLINCVSRMKPLQKMRVLELGSGTGLAGIAWLAKWVEMYGWNNIDMFFTDLEEIVPNLRKNVEVNGLALNSIVSTLDWNRPDDFMGQYSQDKFDVILVSDPIYSPNHPRLVVDVIAKMLAAEGTCHLEIPLRDKYAQERNHLWELLGNRGLRVVEQIRDEGVDDWGQVSYMYQKIEWQFDSK